MAGRQGISVKSSTPGAVCFLFPPPDQKSPAVICQALKFENWKLKSQLYRKMGITNKPSSS